MRNCLRRRCWLKLAALAAAGGSLFQTSACNQTPSGLAGDLTSSIVNTYIVSFFSDQFNVSGSFF